MKLLWIGGWGILPAWGLAHVKAHFPEASHEWRPPSPNALVDYESFDGLAGYSLGANILLRAGLGPRALLLAPFVDFKKESGLSGKISLTQLRYVRRWLERDPLAALNDFFDLACLSCRASELPYNKEDLLWGVDQLILDGNTTLGEGCTAILGTEDPLLDVRLAATIFSKSKRIEGAGHDLPEVLQGTYLKI